MTPLTFGKYLLLPPVQERGTHSVVCLKALSSTVLSIRCRDTLANRRYVSLPASAQGLPFMVTASQERDTLTGFPPCGRKARATPVGFPRGPGSSGFLLFLASSF